MNDTLDYHEMAKAQVEYPDNEADKIVAAMPDEMREFYAKTKQLPTRGAMPGERRLAVVQALQTRVERRVQEQTENAARQERARVAAAAKSEINSIRRTLGGYSGELNQWARDWAAHIEAGKGTVQEFNRQLLNQRQSAQSGAAGSAAPQPPARRPGIF